MATNNLLVNNEQKVLYEQTKKVERSPHNLSQSRKFPCRVGYIYPFFCRKTLPSDSFKIWSNILVKQLQPLLVPQMVSFTVNTAFYWVDYTLAFPDFEYFLINQKGDKNIELPYVRLRTPRHSINDPLLPEISASSTPGDVQSIHPYSSNLRTFLDFTDNACNEKVEALPFWSYQTIKREFYTNIDRLSESQYQAWFPQESKWKLRPGVNYAIGDYKVEINGDRYLVNGPHVNLDRVAVHDVRGDYFVNSYPTPLRGDIPVLNQDFNISSFNADINNFNPNLDLSLSTLDDRLFSFNVDNIEDYGNGALGATFYKKSSDSRSLGLAVPSQGLPEIIPISDVRTRTLGNDGSIWSAIDTNFHSIKSLLDSSFNARSVSFSNITGLSSNLSFTTRQLRLLESLTRKREIDIMMKPRLKNYLNTYFGVSNYKSDSLYQPVFIGSTTQQILINDIEQTTATSDSPLGRQGATAMSLGNNYVGEFYCRNYGCLMGVMYILPDYDYEPAIPREWQERTPDDFVNPEFTHLSMQPILNKELFVSEDKDWNNEVLGYMGMYDNYRTSVNLVSGEFLDDNMKDVQQFAQVRRFEDDNRPEITSSFLNSNTAFDSSVFSVPTLPPFIAQCVARVEAVRPLPQLAIPRG